MLRSPGFPLLLVLFLNVSACGGSSNSPSNPSPNAAPTVMDDAGNSDNGRAVTLAVLANDSSPVGSALQVSGYTNPAHGVLTLANGVFTYVPDAGYYGQDQFRYTASDRNNRSASAQVTIQSRIKLNLRGIVEGQVMGAQVRHSANDDLISSSGVGGRFSIELVTTDADAVLQLEARGVGSDSFIRYAVLLGTAKRLLASVRDPQSATPTLDAEHYARLNLGAIGTAEYGMLRELANTDDLLDADKLARLQAFVDGEALLERAVLIARALANPTQRTVADTLLLASDPVALTALRSPGGSVGSGGVDNESQIALDKSALRSNRTYYSSTQLLGDGASWIGSDPHNRSSRMMLVQRWLGDRLDNHEQLFIGAPGDDVERRSLSSTVHAAHSEQQVVLSAADPTTGLGSRSECDGTSGTSACVLISRTLSLTLRPFFDHYLRVSADAMFAEESAPRLLSDQLATLAPGYARSPPGQVLLSLCGDCTASIESWITDRVQFDDDGRYTQILRGYPPSVRSVSGTWQLRSGAGPQLTDSVSGDLHEVNWIAESSGRSLAIVSNTHAASGVSRVVLSEWAELPAADPELPANLSRCEPVVDGYLLGRSLSSTAVPGERLLLLPDRRYIRTFDPELTEQPTPFGTWTLRPDALGLFEFRFDHWEFLPRLELPDNHWLLLETRYESAFGSQFARSVEYARLSVPRLFRCV